MAKRLIIALLVLAGIFGGIAYWKYLGFQRMAAAMSQPRPPTTIATVEVKQDQWQPLIAAVGSLNAKAGIEVSSEVAGVVREIFFESGEAVAKNSPLIRLDDEVDQAALDVLEAEAKLAEVQFQRAQDLLPKRALSQSEFDERQASVEAARARVVQQQAVIARKRVRAPFAGLLGIRLVDPGQYIEPGQAIVSLQALDPIYLDFALPERTLPLLAVGMGVRASVGAFPGRQFTGTLTAIAPEVDEGTRMVRLRATLPNPEGDIRPGMFAQLQTLLGGTRGVLTVPHTAISYNTYGDFVYVVKAGADGGLQAFRRQITAGEIRDGWVVVEQGLEAGETVVRAGLIKLRDGQPVAVDNSVQLDDATVTKQ